MSERKKEQKKEQKKERMRERMKERGKEDRANVDSDRSAMDFGAKNRPKINVEEKQGPLSQNFLRPQWNSAFFCIFVDYRGQHRKGVVIYNATKVNLQPKPRFH